MSALEDSRRGLAFCDLIDDAHVEFRGVDCRAAPGELHGGIIHRPFQNDHVSRGHQPFLGALGEPIGDFWVVSQFEISAIALASPMI
jgi:hypothetical protein